MRSCVRCGNALSTQGWHCWSCDWQPPSTSGIVCLAPELIGDHDGNQASLLREFAHVEDRNFWFAYRRRLIIEALSRWLPQIESFLDLSCGAGKFLDDFRTCYPAATLVAADRCVDALREVRREYGFSCLQMDPMHLPFADAFDVIGAFDVLQHAASDGIVLDQLRKACRQGGGIVVTVPHQRTRRLRGNAPRAPEARYTLPALIRKVNAAGFTVVHSQTFCTLALPLMTLSMSKQRTRPFPMAVGDHRRRGPILNDMFGGLCMIERQLEKGGVRFANGDGALIVAVRRFA